MDIDVRQLRSFVAIFELGSLSRAAAQMACTQAAMSMRLKWLETELGEALFLRQHHHLEPTFKGTEFYARALTVLAAYDEMISQSRSHSRRSKIRVGIPDDYALGYLPNALRTMKSASSEVEIEITCDLSANLAAALSRHEIDLAVVTLTSIPAHALATTRLPLHWVMAENYQFERGQPIALAAYPEGCVFRRAMIQSLEEAGMPWTVVVQSQNRAGIVGALHGELAVSAVAAGTAPHGLREIIESPWLPALPQVSVSVLSTSKELSPECLQLAKAITNELQRQNEAAATGQHFSAG